MPGSELDDDLGLARHLGALSAEVALGYFQRPLRSERKSDGSLVTEADHAVDLRLFQELQKARPFDAVLSEESGLRGSGKRCWVLDPIDGTSWFAAGRSSWGTHIALAVDGHIVLGVVTRPLSQECYWAARGLGAHRGMLGSDESLERIRVSTTGDPTRARVMVWQHGPSALSSRLRDEGRWVEPTLDGLLDVARGRIDALIDTLGHPWDLAPALPLIEEAGGRFSDHRGGRRWDLTGCLAGNGLLDVSAIRDGR